jgi:double-stranded uracil-DNA glycosylase
MTPPPSKDRPPSAARPTPEQVAAAVGRRVPDVAREGLRVLFIGINPGLYSAAAGHHFARPGNRFWNALHLGGMTPTVLHPDDELELLPLGIGVTNMVPRATAAAAELSEKELRTGAQALERKLRSLRPAFAAFLGLGAFRTAFGRPGAVTGEQPRRIGDTRVWLLPNPSGLNAGHQLPDLARDFADLAKAAGFRAPRRPRSVG